MKTAVLVTFLLLTVLTNAQSVLTLGSGTSMGVFAGADLCYNILAGPGILYGGGTICGSLGLRPPITLNELPSSFDMSQNYPNPFNPVTTIKYQLPKTAYLTIKLYDQLGRVVETQYEGIQQAGYYRISVDGSNFASGVYFCRITTDGFTKVIKMLLIK